MAEKIFNAKIMVLMLLAGILGYMVLIQDDQPVVVPQSSGDNPVYQNLPEGAPEQPTFDGVNNDSNDTEQGGETGTGDSGGTGEETDSTGEAGSGTREAPGREASEASTP